MHKFITIEINEYVNTFNHNCITKSFWITHVRKRGTEGGLKIVFLSIVA